MGGRGCGEEAAERRRGGSRREHGEGHRFAVALLPDRSSPAATPSHRRSGSLVERGHSLTLEAPSPSPSQTSGCAVAGSQAGAGAPSGGERQVSSLWLAERYRRLVNLLVHHSPTLLQTAFAPLLKAPRLLDFDNK